MSYKFRVTAANLELPRLRLAASQSDACQEEVEHLAALVKRLEDSNAARQVQFERVVTQWDALDGTVKERETLIAQQQELMNKAAEEKQEQENIVAQLADTAAERQDQLNRIDVAVRGIFQPALLVAFVNNFRGAYPAYNLLPRSDRGG